jgi:hypothetical protein
MEAELAAETPAQKADRIKRLETNRRTTSEQVKKQPLSTGPSIVRNTRGVTIGMTRDEALASSWGKPQSINRTTSATGTIEQWVYGGQNYLYFNNGILTSYQN